MVVEVTQFTSMSLVASKCFVVFGLMLAVLYDAKIS